MPVNDPNTYATLPAGTEVYWGTVDAADADLALLKDALTVGQVGKESSTTDATRLIDRTKKEMAAMPEAIDKEFTFLDDPADTDLTAFLAAAEAQETVRLRIVFPNGRYNNLTLALVGWSQAEPDDGPLKVVVTSKQNDIKRGVGATLQHAPESNP